MTIDEAVKILNEHGWQRRNDWRAIGNEARSVKLAAKDWSGKTKSIIYPQEDAIAIAKSIHLEAALAECEQHLAAEQKQGLHWFSKATDLERKLAAAREALQDILNYIRSSHKVGIGAPNNTYVPQISVAQVYEWEKPLAALTEAGERKTTPEPTADVPSAPPSSPRARRG